MGNSVLVGCLQVTYCGTVKFIENGIKFLTFQHTRYLNYHAHEDRKVRKNPSNFKLTKRTKKNELSKFIKSKERFRTLNIPVKIYTLIEIIKIPNN